MTINSFTGRNHFLSNFYLMKFPYCGLTYPSVEHAFQAAKMVNQSDHDRILCAKSPGAAKRLGRKSPMRDDWDSIKNAVMFQMIHKKFSVSTKLKRRLLDTDDEELIEGNFWHDNYWGDCGCDRCEDTPGANYLGNILMRVRGMLADGR